MTDAKPWLRYYPEEIAPNYEYPKHNLAQFLIDSAGRYPNHTALYFLGKKTSYAELLQASYRFAHVLESLHIQKGDRVAIMLPNCPQNVIAFYGTLLIGAIVVQTNPLYVERELEHQMCDSGAVALITLDLLLPRVLKVQKNTKLKHVIVTSIKDALPFPKNMLYPLKMKKEGHSLHVEETDSVLIYRKLLAASNSDPIAVEVDPTEDIALLQYTGGTTGLSKGVMLTHYNLISNTIQSRQWCYQAVEGQERYMAALPFFHVFGLTVLLNQAVYMAGMLILLPRFDLNMLLPLIPKLKPTIFPGAPTMYVGLLHHPRIKEYDLSSIKVCISGAAPLPLEVQERFEALTGGRIIEGYGLTEASPVTHANPIWGYRKIGTIGLPYPDTDMKIINTLTGEPCAVGEIGEMAVRGPQIMKGYWNRKQETDAVLQDGWLLTGDMARVDDEGFSSIVDRKKDLIIAGGFNIYPREVEEVLYEHPEVKEVVIAGVPDAYRGETIKAYVVRKEGAFVTEAELDVWCRERLSAIKVPRIYEFRESLPITIIGKVLRRKLLEEEAEKRSS